MTYYCENLPRLNLSPICVLLEEFGVVVINRNKFLLVREDILKISAFVDKNSRPINQGKSFEI